VSIVSEPTACVDVVPVKSVAQSALPFVVATMTPLGSSGLAVLRS